MSKVQYCEEAAFWDTHDFTDYWDELLPVTVTFGKGLCSLIVINLDDEMHQRVSKAARTSDTEPDDLVSGWILERLRDCTASLP